VAYVLILYTWDDFIFSSEPADFLAVVSSSLKVESGLILPKEKESVRPGGE
jgi:hypothetical protein